MFVRNTFRLVIGLAVCITFLFACSITQAQYHPFEKPSDPAALAVVKDYLNTFGDDVYHCKWEYNAQRALKSPFQNGKDKIHVEGEWSFSAKLGSSYIIRYDGVEYTIREIEEGKILAFWPEVAKDGQKFRMHLAPFYISVFPYDLYTMRNMIYPCEVRHNVLMDKWGNPTVFGLKSSDSEKTIISINPLEKNFCRLLFFQTNDGIQAVNETWEVTKADPGVYETYNGSESETVCTNVRVNNAWLPSEVTFKRTQDVSAGEDDLFESAHWSILGPYTVDQDTSMFKNIDPPDGTLFFDEQAMTNRRIGY